MTSFIKVRLKKINYNLWHITTWKAFEHRYGISAESKWRLFQISKYNVNMANFYSFKKLIILYVTKGLGFFSLFPWATVFFLKRINLFAKKYNFWCLQNLFLDPKLEGKMFFFHFVLPLQYNCHFFICEISILDFSRHTGYNLLTINYSR